MLRKQLRKHVYADQSPRNEYANFLLEFDTWWEAAAEWARIKEVSSNDIFCDAKRQAICKPLIYEHINEIISDAELQELAWIIVQHMDGDAAFQKWFLSYLPIGSTCYQYLFDRIAVNAGCPQQFGTQYVE